MDAVLLNAKGFGGNNATASVLAPHVTLKMLARRHGADALRAWQDSNEKVRQRTADYDEAARRGSAEVIYRFDHNVLDASAFSISREQLQVNGHTHPIALQTDCEYADMIDDDKR
jgi:acetoacetyl-[acyl-carrier protein] synthase